jgi:predicted RND superfamily exporter protein
MASSTEVSAKIFTITISVGIFLSYLHSTACTPVILLHHQNSAAAKHETVDTVWFKTDVLLSTVKQISEQRARCRQTT